MKVLIAAKEIPDGATVSKGINSSYTQTLKYEFKIYGEGGITATPPENCVFLVQREQVNIIEGNKELIWHVSRRDLLNHLEELTESGDFK